MNQAAQAIQQLPLDGHGFLVDQLVTPEFGFGFGRPLEALLRSLESSSGRNYLLGLVRQREIENPRRSDWKLLQGHLNRWLAKHGETKVLAISERVRTDLYPSIRTGVV